jgi:thiol-disulfide isomerase/thioredoxin
MSRLELTKCRCTCGKRTRTRRRSKCLKAALCAEKIAPKPFDVADYRGKRQVRMQIQRAGGKSVAGARYRVELTRGYGQARTLQKGQLDKNGAFVLRNLYENPANTDAFNAVGYRIYVNGKFARYFTLTQGDGIRDLQITLAPQPGDPAINFTATDLRTGKPVELRTLRGKWVYLEFWATWCEPCHKAMETLRAFLTKHTARRWATACRLSPSA